MSHLSQTVVMHLNGIHIDTLAYKPDHEIPSNGTLVFGQDQDISLGNFDSNQSYRSVTKI